MELTTTDRLSPSQVCEGYSQKLIYLQTMSEIQLSIQAIFITATAMFVIEFNPHLFNIYYGAAFTSLS